MALKKTEMDVRRKVKELENEIRHEIRREEDQILSLEKEDDYSLIELVKKKIDLLNSLLDENLWIESNEKPILFKFNLGSSYIFTVFDETNQYIYQDCIYIVIGPFSEEEKKLLIMEKFDQERKKFERLKNKHEYSKDLKYQRLSIPESVRIIIWKRDGGKCTKCGSRENLEYDHIIPISKGGSNTARNIELLCENCNRSKGAKIE